MNQLRNLKPITRHKVLRILQGEENALIYLGQEENLHRLEFANFVNDNAEIFKNSEVVRKAKEVLAANAKDHPPVVAQLSLPETDAKYILATIRRRWPKVQVEIIQETA